MANGKPLDPNAVPLQRVEAADQSSVYYGMNRDTLVRHAMWGKDEVKAQATEELVRRLWNQLVKKATR